MENEEDFVLEGLKKVGNLSEEVCELHGSEVLVDGNYAGFFPGEYTQPKKKEKKR